MKLREKIFLTELAIFMFLAFGIAGNGDLGIKTPLWGYISLFTNSILMLFQMKYIEICERKEKKKRRCRH